MSNIKRTPAAAATDAAAKLAATLAASNTARDAVIIKHYGDGVTPAAVRLSLIHI